MQDFRNDIREYIDLEIDTLKKLDVDSINDALNLLIETAKDHKRIYVFGNGGSSATASHIANDFGKGVSEYVEDKFRFQCLNDNVPTVMAVANDIGFEEVFRFQLRGVIDPGDIVIAISGSGNSKNVINAVEYAKEQGNKIIGLTGFSGGKLKELSDISLHAPIDSMQVTEDIHMIYDHLMMSIFYFHLCGKNHLKNKEYAMSKIDTNRIQFLNTYIDNLTFEEAKGKVDELIQEDGYHYVVTPNSDIIVKMQDDPELKYICDNADLILTDGQIVVKLSEYLGNPIKERVCMTDFVWDVFDLAVEKGYKVFLFGGKEEVLAKATENIKKRVPQLQIVDSYSPPFGFEKDEKELDKANERIKQSGAEILIVFLGCPKQEKFIASNKDNYQIPISITMGGCVDFMAGGVRRAPLWMQKAGLEWFFRFLQEPRRMWRRYFVDDVRIFKLARKYKK